MHSVNFEDITNIENLNKHVVMNENLQNPSLNIGVCQTYRSLNKLLSGNCCSHTSIQYERNERNKKKTEEKNLSERKEKKIIFFSRSHPMSSIGLVPLFERKCYYPILFQSKVH